MANLLGGMGLSCIMVTAQLFIVPTPTLVGREELYTQLGFFLFSQFWPTDIFIVENCEWYHEKARPA